MRRIVRWFKRHLGPAAIEVTVRRRLPWYWHLGWAAMLIMLGFAIGYWRYAGGSTTFLREEIARLERENKMLRTQAIHVEKQQQVTSVAQNDLANTLALLQEENVRLKEDVTFYKSILEESPGVATVKLHSFKVTRGSRPGEYQYRLLLIQSGRHDRNVQGGLQLILVGSQDGKPVTRVVLGGQPQQGGKINFKYYQPIEGHFSVPESMVAQSLQAKFFPSGSSVAKLTQEVPLPN
ncbi:MAG: hypothetical protein N2Z69_00425 [Methylophilaceae bacterium]|nr:hypothetical protein [Methylophilaceae bacterium]